MLTIWSLVPLPFLNPAWTSGSSPFTYSWSLAWRILSVTLLACEMSAIYGVEHSLALPFSGIGMKTDLFQSCGNCWVFRICWHTEYSTLAAASFSSAGIPSPLLALFVVMQTKTHLISHSKMSGSRRVITPSWLSRSLRSFLHSSSVHFCHLFVISSVRSIPFLSFTEPIFTWNVPLVSLIFLKRSLVFPILLFSSISLHWSLRKTFLSLLAILWNSAFRCLCISFSPLLFASLLFTAICKASPDSHFAFLHFFSMGMVLIPVSCTVSQTSFHSSSGTLSDLGP